MQIIRRFKGAEPGSAARAQFDLDCVDPLGRSALSIAIINENPEMMEVLLENRIKVMRHLRALNEVSFEGKFRFSTQF